MLILGIIIIVPFIIISFSIVWIELAKSGLLDKLYYNSTIRDKELEASREIEKIAGEIYNLKKEKNIIFPDEIKKSTSKTGIPNKEKRMFVSETPEIEYYNVSNKENRRSQNGKFYQEEIQNNIEKDLEFEEDPIQEYSMFERLKKYLRRN